MESTSMTSGREPSQSTGSRSRIELGLWPVVLFALFVAGCATQKPETRELCSSSSSHQDKSASSRRRASKGPRERPRLVVWLTIDQMRADSFERYDHLMGSGGFSHLLSKGLSFAAASYHHANTETAPGHATLFTGAAPSIHGIVANHWLLPDGTKTASVADEAAPLLGPKLGPAERTPQAGRSPHFLLVPTVGDLLHRVTRGAGQVVALSAKDRGAILPAGFSGRAIWLGLEGFVTSRYYENELPGWLRQHHESHPPDAYLQRGWPLLLPATSYRDPPSEHPLRTPRLSAGFPHAVAPGLSPTEVLKFTPFGDEAVLDLARAAAVAYNLGTDEAPDLLSLSLSSTDYVGHFFGPESREAEDNFARLDAALGRFVSELEESVGSDRILWVLSADHGGSESPERLQQLGLRGVRISVTDLVEHAEQALSKEFRIQGLLLGIAPPTVYLDDERLAQANIPKGRAQAIVSAALAATPGIRAVYATQELLAGARPAGDRLAQLVGASLYPGRSGDLYLVAAPYAQFDADGDLVATHGSPYGYDRQVPLVLSGAGVPHGVVRRPVDLRSLAGTVAALLGLPGPAAADAPPLVEALPDEALRNGAAD